MDSNYFMKKARSATVTFYTLTRLFKLDSTQLLSLSALRFKMKVIPRSKLKSYGDHTFSVSAPQLWNGIPEITKCSVDFNTSLLSIILKLIF